jgi:hypothetical protein
MNAGACIEHLRQRPQLLFRIAMLAAMHIVPFLVEEQVFHAHH